MPRLDNSTQDVIASIYCKYYDGYDFDDPGRNAPLDFCRICCDTLYEEFCDLEIDHPSYDEGCYYCTECGIGLDDENDWQNENMPLCVKQEKLI